MVVPFQGYRPSSQLHTRPSKYAVVELGRRRRGEWCQKQETKGRYGRRDDEKMKKEPKSGEPSNDRQKIMVVLQEIPREPESQEDQCAPKNQW